MPGKRRSIRLKGYDYAQEGVYYVTVCVGERACLFGDVRDGEMMLNDAGRTVDKWWSELPQKYNTVKIDEYQVMPNHLHGIIMIVENDETGDVGAGFPRPVNDKGRGNRAPKGRGNRAPKGRGNRAPTLGQIIAYFKYGTTKQINMIRNTPGVRLWQRNYYEHIIRSERDLTRVREYIINNPGKWVEDEYNSSLRGMCTP